MAQYAANFLIRRCNCTGAVTRLVQSKKLTLLRGIYTKEIRKTCKQPYLFWKVHDGVKAINPLLQLPVNMSSHLEKVSSLIDSDTIPQ